MAEDKLEAAMERLLMGEPTVTEGALTKESLYKEAEVSRATMNRHPELLMRWDKAVALHKAEGVDFDLSATRAREALESRHRELVSAFSKSQESLRQAESDLRASATVITALYSENSLLNEKLDSIHRRGLSVLPEP